MSGHPSATGRAQDRESTSAKDRRSTTEPTPPTSMVSRRQENDVQDAADENHRLGDLELRLLRLAPSGVQRSRVVTGHDLRPTTDCEQNAAVAEEKSEDQANVEGQKIPQDDEGHPSLIYSYITDAPYSSVLGP